MTHIRAKRASVGRSVRMGTGSLIEGDSVSIGDHVSIGDSTHIKARRISIGYGTIIENNCTIRKVSGDIARLTLGDNCFIGSDSRIATALFETGDYVSLHNHLFVNGVKPCTIGHNVWVGQNCILNARDTLTIGNGVGIGAYSSVWTHGAHGELLEGCLIYKVAPVTIEDDVWIVGSYNVVSPGVKIGKKAIVMTGSVVTKDVPPGACVAGNPARDISDKLRTYKELSVDKKYAMIMKFVEDFVSARQHVRKTADGWAVGRGKNAYRIRFIEECKALQGKVSVPTVLFTKSYTGMTGHPLVSVFDLTAKTYTKRRTPCEIEIIKGLLYSKARFLPIAQ